jgi:hypothetical protein
MNEWVSDDQPVNQPGLILPIRFRCNFLFVEVSTPKPEKGGRAEVNMVAGRPEPSYVLCRLGPKMYYTGRPDVEAVSLATNNLWSTELAKARELHYSDAQRLIQELQLRYPIADFTLEYRGLKES